MVRITSYDRARFNILKGQPKPKPFVWFDGKKLHVGNMGSSKTRQSCMLRMRWRIRTFLYNQQLKTEY